MGTKAFSLCVIYHILVLCMSFAQCSGQRQVRCPSRPTGDFPHVNVTNRSDQKVVLISERRNSITLSIHHGHSGSKTKLFFDCNASYPVEWVFISPKHNERVVDVTTLRHNPVPSEPWNDVYIARLTISVSVNNKAIKETQQTCRSVQDKACLQTTVTTKRNGPVNNQTWEVTINTDDPRGVILVDSDAAPGINPNCSLSLTYDPTESTFCCRSLVGSNASFYDNTPCHDPIDCRQIYSESSCEGDLESAAPCPSEKSYSLPLYTSENEFQSAGVIICHEDNQPEEMSAAVHYFYSLPKICPEDAITLPNIYFSLLQVRIFEFLSMCEITEPVYVGEKFNFTCVASLYFTSAGMKFALKIHQEDDKAFDHDVEEHLDYVGQKEISDREHGFRNVSREILINDTNIKSVLCYAPQRNSISFISKEVHLTILEPVKITFVDSDIAEVKQFEENLLLRCEAHGNPRPSLIWMQKGNELRKDLNLKVTLDDNLGWTEIRFPPTENPMDFYGEYTCRAQNRLGHKDKLFVIVEKPVKSEEEKELAESTKYTDFYIKAVAVPLIIIVVAIIFVLLVWKIVQQTRKLRKLTHAEIEEFMNGRPDIMKSYRESNYEINSYANCLPYNKKYEILKEQLEIDENSILGTGAYGMVLKGTLTTKAKTKVKVAIKTVKPMDDITYFKVLLSELKIMAFIGKHRNIINLIGAYTSNIERREIYIATEFCDNGNVNSFLKRNRKAFTNLVANGELTADTSLSRASYGSTSSITTVSTINLLKWGSQIADGMDFLGTKKVIHGDLAARNIFLTIDLVVKIGDFGLSKQLFEYANYIKKNQSPLPWKWLAIECLQDMQFSVKSDVWAYGITLWEIFSLGLSPYVGSVYNEEFITRLVSGVRPSIPQYATNKIYDEMLTCWNHSASERPTFKHLKTFFDSQLELVVSKEYMELVDRDSATATVTIECQRN